MNRIEKRMEELQNKNEKAFVTYMTAGLPDMEGTKALIKAQAEAGSAEAGSAETGNVGDFRGVF